MLNRLSTVVVSSTLALSLFIAVPAAQAVDYTLDKAHSSVGFKIRHMVVSKTAGSFKDYDVKITGYDAAKPEGAKIEAVIQTKSVDTANEKRDEHLRGADFFKVDQFPTMTYTSSKVTRAGDKKLKVEGTLTLLGVSKPVTLDVEEGGTLKDPWGLTRTGFTATTKINRKDFGMNYNTVLDNGGLALGEEVEITIEIEATQPTPGADKKGDKKKKK